MKAGKIIIDDAEYSTMLTDKYLSNLEQKKEDKNQILSFIPGIIKDIKVKEGEIVKAGTCFLILEAMKMYNEINLNYDVKIKKICVKKGEIIPNNHPLIKFERI